MHDRRTSSCVEIRLASTGTNARASLLCLHGHSTPEPWLLRPVNIIYSPHPHELKCVLASLQGNQSCGRHDTHTPVSRKPTWKRLSHLAPCLRFRTALFFPISEPSERLCVSLATLFAARLCTDFESLGVEREENEPAVGNSLSSSCLLYTSPSPRD